jgi:hypothetical protein
VLVCSVIHVDLSVRHQGTLERTADAMLIKFFCTSQGSFETTATHENTKSEILTSDGKV